MTIMNRLECARRVAAFLLAVARHRFPFHLLLFERLPGVNRPKDHPLLWDQQSAAAVGRIVAQDNIIELSRQLSFPTGAEFTAAAANRFVDLVARRNIVRQVVDSTRPLLVNASGISFRYCTRAILENNVVDDTEANSAVYYQNCDFTKFFNNQTSAGKLLRGYNQVTSKFTLELDDAVQDVLLAL
jgi:hypothetical protein